VSQRFCGIEVSYLAGALMFFCLGPRAIQADDSKPDDMLLELTRMMQRAEQQMRAGNLASETQQLQQQVIDHLDEWIAAFESQQQQQRRQQRQEGTSVEQGEGDEGASPSERDGDREATPGGDEEPGDATAEGTDAGVGADGEEGVAGGQRESSPASRARDDVWGHLPERIRQQLQSAAVERFLPKYEDLIEAYYQRLAEEEAGPVTRQTP
jgi:hypothetical protein